MTPARLIRMYPVSRDVQYFLGPIWAAWLGIFLAQHGFDVTGVDFAPGAIDLGRRRAAEAGVTVAFVEDDLTDLRHVNGAFDLLVDYGTLDDLAAEARELYVQNVLRRTRREQ